MKMTHADANQLAGCWIDGQWGHYAPVRLVTIAKDSGFRVTHEEQRAIDAYLNGADESEMITYLADQAEAWMNENVAPEGWMFDWIDGEFFFFEQYDYRDVPSMAGEAFYENAGRPLFPNEY